MTLPLNDTGQEFLSWMPSFLQRSQIAAAILDVQAREADYNEADRIDFINQLFVQTADWGLYLWEESLRLPVNPVDETLTPLTDEQRRVLILAKLRSNVVRTSEQWKGIIETYSSSFTVTVDYENGEVEVNITDNPSEFVKAQLEAAVRSVTPAHLDLTITYGGFVLGTSTFGDIL